MQTNNKINLAIGLAAIALASLMSDTDAGAAIGRTLMPEMMGYKDTCTIDIYEYDKARIGTLEGGLRIDNDTVGKLPVEIIMCHVANCTKDSDGELDCVENTIVMLESNIKKCRAMCDDHDDKTTVTIKDRRREPKIRK